MGSGNSLRYFCFGQVIGKEIRIFKSLDKILFPTSLEFILFMGHLQPTIAKLPGKLLTVEAPPEPLAPPKPSEINQI